MNATITLDSTSRRERTRSERLPLHRLIAPARYQRGFTLIEMLVAIVIAVCLIGWYVRAHDEADSLTDSLRRSETMKKVDRDAHQRRTHKARSISMNLAQTGAEADAVNNGAPAMDEADASDEVPQTADEHEPAGETDRDGYAPPLAGE